ncbi:MAG: hypothetical protein ACYTGH_14815 [Planctomycetota bacterium]|jgi:drug/metabolite transporter (DMT)-like permease
MRKGNAVLIATLAYGTPLLSTLIACVYLGVDLEWTLLVASSMVVAGAIVCRKSIQRKTDDSEQGE